MKEVNRKKTIRTGYEYISPRLGHPQERFRELPSLYLPVWSRVEGVSCISYMFDDGLGEYKVESVVGKRQMQSIAHTQEIQAGVVPPDPHSPTVVNAPGKKAFPVQSLYVPPSPTANGEHSGAICQIQVAKQRDKIALDHVLRAGCLGQRILIQP
ncbi:MAG: hypothetical protein WBW48_11970, partial [Anaerolineae bacterium]